MKIKHIFFFFIISFFLINCNTQLKRAEKELPPKYKKFLSEVRYIITQKEKKAFLSTPNTEKDKFINNFWKRRDPVPETEENEYKEEYYKRIKEANKMFTEEGRQGWLTDRGRVYILLGPPSERHVYPTGYSFYDSPSEVWYYNFFPVVFVDEYRIGNYKLTPLGAQYVVELLDSSRYLNQHQKIQSPYFSFTSKILKSKQGKYYLRLILPYKKMLFEKKEDTLKANIVVKILTLEGPEKRKWTFSKDYLILLNKDKINTLINHKIDIETPFKKGSYKIKISVISKKDKIKSSRVIYFKIK